jgi:putative transposase
MPYRAPHLQTGKQYHVFNRSTASERVFRFPYQQKRFLETVKFYQFNSIIPYCIYLKSQRNLQKEFLNTRKEGEQLVRIICFAIMPTHYHFLVQQLVDGGISVFLRNIQISYAKFYNLKYRRHGGVFSGRFGSVQINSAFQLLSTSKYIHLNPVVDSLVSAKLLDYHPFTSMSYFNNQKKNDFLASDQILSHFDSYQEYRAYVLGQ